MICESCPNPSLGGGRWCRRCLDVRFGRGIPAYVGRFVVQGSGKSAGTIVRHGTIRAMHRHWSRGEPSCELCREAHRAYRAARRGQVAA